jgi:uncharacterized protein
MSRGFVAVDTNVLLYALNSDAPECARARSFLADRNADPDTVVSELVLVELYVLLRNPAIFRRPLDGTAAAAVIDQLRHHPAWQIVDHDPTVMTDLWRRAAARDFARTRIFDVRLALGLLKHGVTRFATRNTRDFAGLGFEDVFDPL